MELVGWVTVFLGSLWLARKFEDDEVLSGISMAVFLVCAGIGLPGVFILLSGLLLVMSTVILAVSYAVLMAIYRYCAWPLIIGATVILITAYILRRGKLGPR